jgi:hypothetical protein
MEAKRRSSPAPGPDLLARYLNAYLHARQASEVVRPWGLGDEHLDGLWSRLTEALASDPRRLNRIVADELSAAERSRIIETLAPLIFALPLRSYPAELRAIRSGPLLVLRLRHLNGHSAPIKPESEPAALGEPAGALEKPPKAKGRERSTQTVDSVGYLPAALTEAFAGYLRRVFHWPANRPRGEVSVSSGGRRRRVRVRILARARGIVVHFVERLQSPIDA